MDSLNCTGRRSRRNSQAAQLGILFRRERLAQHLQRVDHANHLSSERLVLHLLHERKLLRGKHPANSEQRHHSVHVRECITPRGGRNAAMLGRMHGLLLALSKTGPRQALAILRR